jgi:hypothetical protein
MFSNTNSNGLDAYSQKNYINIFTKVLKILRYEFHKNFLRFSKRIFKIILSNNVLGIRTSLNFQGIKNVVKESFLQIFVTIHLGDTVIIFFLHCCPYIES